MKRLIKSDPRPADEPELTSVDDRDLQVSAEQGREGKPLFDRYARTASADFGAGLALRGGENGGMTPKGLWVSSSEH